METQSKIKRNYKKPRFVSNGVNISVKNESIEKSANEALAITGITSSVGIMYYDLPIFIKKFNLSYSTISRYIDKLRYHRDFWRYFVKVGNKNYVSCGIIGNKKKFAKQYSNKEYSQWLRCYNWDLVGSVRYHETKSDKTARNTMEKLFRHLEKKYYDKQLIFVFVTEPNPANDGYHNHFLLGYQSELVNTPVKEFIESTLRSKKMAHTASTLIQPYRSEDNFIDYLVKQIHIYKEGYDFLSNNLL